MKLIAKRPEDRLQELLTNFVVSTVSTVHTTVSSQGNKIMDITKGFVQVYLPIAFDWYIWELIAQIAKGQRHQSLPDFEEYQYSPNEWNDEGSKTD